MPESNKFRMVKNDDNSYSLYIYTDIGESVWDRWSKDPEGLDRVGVSAAYVRQKLREIPDDATLNIYINSNGGDVFEAASIASNLARKSGKVTGIVDGACHSAAFSILQACSHRVMMEGTGALIHNPWTFAMGNAAEIRAAADALEAVTESVRSMYLHRSRGNISADEIAQLMDRETILTPKAALAYGLIDEIRPLQQEEESESKNKAQPAWQGYVAGWAQMRSTIALDEKNRNDIAKEMETIVQAMDTKRPDPRLNVSGSNNTFKQWWDTKRK